MRFKAACIVSQIQDDIALLGFADDEFDTTQYVTLQRELSRLPQEEIELGFDKLHIEVNSQGHGDYDEVAGALLLKNQLVLRLSPETAEEIGVDDVIAIDFEVSVERVQEISDMLVLLMGSEVVAIDDDIRPAT